jgi:hypothetical protein
MKRTTASSGTIFILNFRNRKFTVGRLAIGAFIDGIILLRVAGAELGGGAAIIIKETNSSGTPFRGCYFWKSPTVVLDKRCRHVEILAVVEEVKEGGADIPKVTTVLPREIPPNPKMYVRLMLNHFLNLLQFV